MSTAVPPNLAPIVALCFAGHGFLLNAAINFLDKNKSDYASRVDSVISINRDEARRKLKWIADDFSNAKSTMSLTHLDSETYVYRQTKLLSICFQRIRKCRIGLKRARAGYEVTKWASTAGLVICAMVAIASVFSVPFEVTSKMMVGAFVALGVSIISFAFCLTWLQIINNHHDDSKDLDAAIPS